MTFKPLKKVFAVNGDFSTPPETASTTVANQETGFPVIQSTPLASGGLPVSRAEMNGAFHFYSGHILNYTLGNFYDADVSNASYYAYRSTVRDVLNGTPHIFIAKVDNPTSNPVIGGTTFNYTEWEIFGGGGASGSSLVGIIHWFSYGDYTTTHEGFLPCNGAEVSRNTYAELFAKIGTTYGSGNGSTTFNLPDLRDKFIRGLGTVSESLGTAQGDAIRNITGSITETRRQTIFAEPTGAFNTTNKSGNQTYDGNLSQSGGKDTFNLDASNVVPTANENRPVNMAMVPFIKYI